LVSEGIKDVVSRNRGAEPPSNSKTQAKVNLVAPAVGQVAALPISSGTEKAEKTAQVELNEKIEKN
jgi:hypothetical protein